MSEKAIDTAARGIAALYLKRFASIVLKKYAEGLQHCYCLMVLKVHVSKIFIYINLFKFMNHNYFSFEWVTVSLGLMHFL